MNNTEDKLKSIEVLRQQLAIAPTPYERQKLRHAIRYLEKRAEILEHQKGYYQENRLQRLKYDEDYRESHREERAAYHHNHNEENKARLSVQHAKYELEHEEERKAYHQRYCQEHLTDYLERRRKRRALIENTAGSFTQGEFEELCEDCDNKCTYCGTEGTGTLVPDHMTPLCRGGSNSINNITPACQTCNSSKHSKTYEEYVAWREYTKQHDITSKNLVLQGGDKK